MTTETEKKYIVLDSTGFANESGWIEVYNYSYDTKEFSGKSEEFLQVGVGIPAQSTVAVPPESKEGFANVYDTEAKSWTQVEDHRGITIYSTTSDTIKTVSELGPIDTTKYTTTAPTSQYDEWDGEKWVVNAEKKKAAEVAAANSTKKVLYSEADRNITDLQFAVDLEIATDTEVTELTSWKKYCVYLNRVDTSKAPEVVWPDKPTR